MPPRGGRKTIKIPQFKMPQRGSGEIDGMWATLESAINQIFGKEQSKLSYEVLYRNAYNMCLQKQGERLYSSVRQTVSRHLQRQADAVAAQEGDQFMAAMQRQWCDYKLSITMVRDVCMYLDRTWIQQQGVPAVFEMGLELFRDLVVRDGRICSRLLRTMLGYVEREREGEAVPRDVAKSMVDMWWNISPTCYAEDFERPLLQASATYYARVVHDLAAERPARGCAAYFREVGARLEDERARAQRYLHAVTGPKLEGIVHEAMLSVGADSHMEAQLRDPALGLRAQLIGDEHEALALQYELLRASTARGGAALLAELAERELSDYATDTVTDPVLSEDPLRFVGALLAMQRKFEGLLSRAFMRDGELTAVLHRCLGGAINLRDSVAKQMVNFCDALLRKGGLPDPPSEPEVERKLDELVGLYTCECTHDDDDAADDDDDDDADDDGDDDDDEDDDDDDDADDDDDDDDDADDDADDNGGMEWVR
jgi:cullin 3